MQTIELIRARLDELERQRNTNYWGCHMQASMRGYRPLPRSFYEERAELERQLKALSAQATQEG